MVLGKVKSQLVEGLKEKENFLNMVREVLERYEYYGVISKKSKEVHSKNYNSFQYAYKDFGLKLNFFHSTSKFYFLIDDLQKKYRSFQRMDIWPQCAIIDIFDLNVRNFPLERHEQLLRIHKLFESCFEKIDNNI
jgi:hypothetical protein